MKRTSVLLSLSLGSLITTAAFGITGGPAAITYMDNIGRQHIDCFAAGNNGDLVVNYWDGFHWYWRDQGLPTGFAYLDLNVTPVAITFASGGQQLIYVFAAAFSAIDGSEHVVVNYWTGTGWYWRDQGLPTGFNGLLRMLGLTAVTYASGGHQLIDVFTSSQDPNAVDFLLVNSWDGSNWNWAPPHALPAGIISIQDLTAITYAIPQFGWIQQNTYVFGVANNGHLFVNYSYGSNWYWRDQGPPPGSTGLNCLSSPTAITFASGGQQLIYVFATAFDGDLVVNYWNGTGWLWADQGLPPDPAGTTQVFSPSAITFPIGGVQWIYVFGTASGPQQSQQSLVVNYWDGFKWHWANQGLPANMFGVFDPSAITYSFSPNTPGFQEIDVFALGDSTADVFPTTDLVVNCWNTVSWFWLDQGNM